MGYPFKDIYLSNVSVAKVWHAYFNCGLYACLYVSTWSMCEYKA